MNKSIKNLRIKTISIVCASLAVLAVIIGLAFVSLSPSKAAPGTVTFDFTLSRVDFDYSENENYDTNFTIQVKDSTGDIKYSNVVTISGGQRPAAISTSDTLEQGTMYTVNIIAPTFSNISVQSSSIGGGQILYTNSFNFVMTDNVTINISFSLTQETWFNDSNVF